MIRNLIRNVIRNRIQVSVLLMVLSLGISMAAGQSAATESKAVVPTLASFSGRLTDLDGKPLTSLTGVTFSLYKDSEGGAPLWMEVQNVQPDKAGHYTLTLGSTRNEGLPTSLFASGEARWLGVQPEGQAEQPRVLLLSVPYALKAGDAETVGGLPASAFMLAVAGVSGVKAANSTATPESLPPASVSGSGTAKYIPLWTSSTALANSVLFQSGSGSTAKIGIGNTAPSATLDVTGGATIRGLLNLPNAATATATAGADSRPFGLVASTFNSGTGTASNQVFHWQAEPVGNNTATPSATLNLLFATAPAAAAETGLKINSKGIITFASGQTFPGGSGTITGVTAGTGLTGGGTSGVVTLNLDSSKVPQLGTSNDFTAPQEFQANAGVGVVPSGTTYTPLSIGSANGFGTWFSIANTSAGGHTWNILSAGAGNAEGAGNLGISDLTGKSTIWLEGNTNTGNLNATGTATAASINADPLNKNAGGPTPGIVFGAGSGEGIASNRTIGLTKFGLDFYTEFAARMSILQNGQVGIGTQNPGAGLAVVSNIATATGILAQAGNATNGSNQDGGTGLEVFGGSGDLNSNAIADGGVGITADGGLGADFGGDGGDFTGSANVADSAYGGGDGIVAIVGSSAVGDFAPNAGFFQGQITATQGVNSSSAIVQMDHPLDPANKLLQHATVQSPDMKNIYDGNITTDAAGKAVVELPSYFEALNRDFRYQLTVIGQFAQAIVASKIANNRFIVHTDKPNVEVSWQVTGIRQDAWANAHRVNVEPIKPDLYRGHYLHPELYGAPEEAGMEWARRPQQMKKIKDERQRRLHAAQSSNVAR